ncbi:MAG: CmpA/NrtA family ABC transporter substrate-binding protein [Chthoniobacteraceae bacterium]
MRKTHQSKRPLRLGFVALADCAPIVMAQELGLFAEFGVAVELRREVGWATIRDKIIYGELEAAHAPAGVVVAASCGLGSIHAECVTGLILNLQGNAVTLSEKLWQRGVRNGDSLREAIRDASHRFTFGVVHNYSAHSGLLRIWLRDHGIDPERDVQIVVVPPPQVHANLRAGHLDGYCVGEPWNSLAVLSKTGWCVTTSMDLAPRHPEKVLIVRKDFATHSEGDHLAVIAALIKSCAFCEKPENRERLIETLAQSKYVGAPIQALRMGMSGTFNYGHDRIEKQARFHIFSEGNANEPTREKARWVIDNLLSSGLVADPTLIPREKAGEWFRADIYQQALKLTQQS